MPLIAAGWIDVAMTTDRGRFPYTDILFKKMNRITRWLSASSVLAMSLVLWSCDSAPDAIQPELSPSPVVVTSTSGRRFTVMTENGNRAETASAQIGRQGGVVTLGRHSLYVAPGAVTETATFTITRDAENPLRVKLTAGRQSENDVGAKGFSAPVYLVLNYANASETPRDPGTLQIVFFRPDGLVEELNTEVQIWGKYAVARLPHFSLFGLAWPL